MSKRASTSQLSSSTNKKAGLATYFAIPAPKTPSPLIGSDPITDRQSTFVAHATTITTEHGAKQFHKVRFLSFFASRRLCLLLFTFIDFFLVD